MHLIHTVIRREIINLATTLSGGSRVLLNIVHKNASVLHLCIIELFAQINIFNIHNIDFIVIFIYFVSSQCFTSQEEEREVCHGDLLQEHRAQMGG